MPNKSNRSKARLSISTWSLNKALGQPNFFGVEQGFQVPMASHNLGELSLVDIPKAISEFGINTLEIPHFHLASLDDEYLATLKNTLRINNVELFSLLIDDGDITHPEHAERDLNWIMSMLDVAAKLGSTCVRVIAGKQAPTQEVLELSISNLKRLAAKADELGLRLMTENWFETTSTPQALIQIIEALEGQLGLCLDFGNWQGDLKYSNFEQIAKYAESCHSKAYFENGVIDTQDFKKCLDIVHAENFSGPYTLIFESPEPSNEWQGLAAEKEIILQYII